MVQEELTKIQNTRTRIMKNEETITKLINGVILIGGTN